jgi:hypothetical protein
LLKCLKTTWQKKAFEMLAKIWEDKSFEMFAKNLEVRFDFTLAILFTIFDDREVA